MTNVIDSLRDLLTKALETRGAPLTVALDGRSGSGKSTLADALVAVLPAVIVPSDDFFAAQITRAEWDARNPMERARDAIDLSRLRRLALEPLRVGVLARWQPFDFAAGERADGSYGISTAIEQRSPAPLILLEGAYSARPEIADLLDLTILLEASAPLRKTRLEAREPASFLSGWHERWDGAEDYYFNQVRPATSFDFVVDADTGVLRIRSKLSVA